MNSIQERVLGPYTVLLISLLAFILMVLFVSDGEPGAYQPTIFSPIITIEDFIG